MSAFFINRPIVAMVIAILMVIIGLVAMVALPIAQYPNIVPTQVQVSTTYVGADALTVQNSVATPIEQQMSGVDNMTYMYSVNQNNGNMTLNVDFDLKTNPDTDQILAQMRETQAQSQLPQAVQSFGLTVQKSPSAPLMLFALYSPKGSWDSTFLANYAYINLVDAMTRVPGIASVSIFGAGQYAMRMWVNPDVLAKLDVTVSEIVNAIQTQNTVNPAGMVGAEPVPPGQDFTYAARAQGRLVTEEQFGNIVVRANTDGSYIRVKDVARIELGAQVYNIQGRLNGKPAAIIALYQLPNTNALQAAQGARKLMENAKKVFPNDLDYVVALDTTLAVTAGIEDIVQTLWEALALVAIVVFVFLQGWRASLIPLLAVPVSLVGTFILFPLLGFSINTLSLFGLVLAIGLVVDDAIVVVEAVEHHIENGLSPKEAALQAMRDVGGPVVAIALILASVFIPTAFIPGLTGRLYQQFAVTIATAVLFSAFNALTLSPALSALLLRPKKEGRGPLAMLFRGFNFGFGKLTNGYVGICGLLVRRGFLSIALLIPICLATGWFGSKLPPGFLPEEDQGYMYLNVQLPQAASLQRTGEICAQVEEILKNTPGVEYYSTVVGFSLLSQVQMTYSGFFFVSFKPWSERTTPETSYWGISKRVNQELAMKIPGAMAFDFAPPAIPGIGTSGGVTFMLEDRQGRDTQFLAEQMNKFMAAARKRPEISFINTTYLPTVPQIYVDVDRDKVLKQGVQLGEVYQTLQAFMGGVFINYFNRFGRVWQVYVEAEGAFRTKAENVGEFYVRGEKGAVVPMSALIKIENKTGPEFTMRFNLYSCAQINANAAPGYSSNQVMKALEEVFQTMPPGMGYDYQGMSFQEKEAQKGVSPTAIFGLSLLFVFLILAAQYESWSLPFSVLLGTPIAVMGAFIALYLRGMQNNIYAQIGLVMLIGLAAKNAILIIEFARSELEKGKGIAEAALAGARLRLRPILMTAFAFIFGCLPLALATGSGAVSRQVLGTTVIGGMVAATLLAIFLIPVCFDVVERLTHSEKKGAKPADQPPPVQPTDKPVPGAGPGDKN